MYMVTSKPKRISLYSGVDHFIDVSSRLIDETVINFFVYTSASRVPILSRGMVDIKYHIIQLVKI